MYIIFHCYKILDGVTVVFMEGKKISVEMLDFVSKNLKIGSNMCIKIYKHA